MIYVKLHMVSIARCVQQLHYTPCQQCHAAVQGTRSITNKGPYVHVGIDLGVLLVRNSPQSANFFEDLSTQLCRQVLQKVHLGCLQDASLLQSNTVFSFPETYMQKVKL